MTNDQEKDMKQAEELSTLAAKICAVVLGNGIPITPFAAQAMIVAAFTVLSMHGHELEEVSNMCKGVWEGVSLGVRLAEQQLTESLGAIGGMPTSSLVHG